LFYKAVPTRSLVKDDFKYLIKKGVKERLTLLLGCSLEGEKLTPVIIGKMQNQNA